MSSTHRGAKRDLHDHYSTPPALALLICEHLRDWFGKAKDQPRTILEPSCGEGAFIESAKNVWPDAQISGVELNDELLAAAQRRGHAVLHADYLRVTNPGSDLIITNPPFALAQAFIEKSLRELQAGGHAAFLLRLNFLASKRRFRELWGPTRRLQHVFVLPDRPSFTPDGKKDSIDYMLALFTERERQPEQRVTMSFIDNTKISNKLRGDEVRTSYVPNPNRG